jgi:hypothetical protein
LYIHFRQEFKTPPELIENNKLNDLTIKEVKSEEDIKTLPSKMKQESTLMEFGFKPRSSKFASSLSTPVSVAKLPDRKDTYSNDDESFETPPYIKKERSDHLQRKAKSVTIKAMNATKKNKEAKKLSKKIPTKIKDSKQSPTCKLSTGKFNRFNTEEEEKEYNCKTKHAWYKSNSRKLRLEHEEGLRILNGHPVPGEILTYPTARLATKNCKHCFQLMVKDVANVTINLLLSTSLLWSLGNSNRGRCHSIQMMFTRSLLMYTMKN